MLLQPSDLINGACRKKQTLHRKMSPKCFKNPASKTTFRVRGVLSARGSAGAGTTQGDSIVAFTLGDGEKKNGMW